VQWDAGVPAVWDRSAPDLWEKGTGLSIVRGACSGALCIQVHTDAGGTPCSPEYGGNCAGQWEPGLPDLHTQTCHVWLSSFMAAQPVTRYFSARVFSAVVTHEVGHCLGYWQHSSDPRSVMSTNQSPSDPPTRPTRDDYAIMTALWALAA
jgi:hypothetical protein